ncbi:MAG TPA: 50S ribosomal protein L22 [Patescibacteria group bacterium]|nr:50S ribosomal protein L22 [Patescibacteria group bacterium]
MVVKASAKGVQMSPRKTGVVASLVRGRTVSDAITILEHTPRRASLPVKKVIESAKANAENNHNLQSSTLLLTSISVTPGPRIKRYRPAAHGRALPFQRKSSHIFVEITGEEKSVKKPVSTQAKLQENSDKKTDGGKK